MKNNSILIVAHPGHELLLHRWLEIENPVVFALTDGSGGRGVNRTERSRAVIAATGSRSGAVFGETTDREWYAAILHRDATPFAAAAERILNDLGTVHTVVVDAIEHFNPMHDLAAVVATIVARRAGASRLLCYAIENEAPADIATWMTELDDAQWNRKRDAARSYLELAAEVDAFTKRSDRLRREALFDFDPDTGFPETLAVRPSYERFGQQRMQEGRFSNLITYDEHVRPLARELIEQAAE